MHNRLANGVLCGDRDSKDDGRLAPAKTGACASTEIVFVDGSIELFSTICMDRPSRFLSAGALSDCAQYKRGEHEKLMVLHECDQGYALYADAQSYPVAILVNGSIHLSNGRRSGNKSHDGTVRVRVQLIGHL